METPFGHTNVPIAIVGMACRLPGADNLEQFWKLLISGGSSVAELPHERLDQELYYDPRRGQRGKTYSKNGAIISSRKFDSQACPIPKSLERSVDNAHLLMCQTAGEALRHAGFDPFNLALRNAGVYIGHAQGSDLAAEYTYGTCIEDASLLLSGVPGFLQLPAADQQAIASELVETVRSQMPKRTTESPDVAINMVAGTISKAFGLNGPFTAVNSACASSLQAVMLGVRALQLGRIDMAIVGGASDCKSDSLVLFSHAQSMSETGSRPFDATADGLICSEGYVALVLKTLPRALADGDPIQAVIRGLGMSSDGRGKSLWAPRKEGQIKAMERAYRHDVDMSTLQYIEAHATSTNLGDATELNALTEVLGKKFPPGKKIPVTSVKANIGHALEAAGVSSVIKTILCLQHKTFVPAINIQSLNTKINWDQVPFYINREVAPWPEQPTGLPRRAGVNAFGIGGLNLHIVLEEFTEAHRAKLNAAHKNNGQAAASATAAPTKGAGAEAVAVIGIGCIFPGASQPAKFWDLLTSGRDPKGMTPPGRLTEQSQEPGSRRPYRTPTTLGGYITDFAYDWRKHKEPPKHVQQADPLQFMLLEAAEQALIDSGYDKKEFDRTRLGVLVGTEFGGDFSAQLELGLRLPHIEQILKKSMATRGVAADRAAKIAAEFSDVMLKHWPALIDESGSFSTSTLASRITKTMNLMGGAAAIDSSDASSAAALTASVDMLLSGDCDMMMCAGGQRCMNLPQYEAMAINGVLALDAKPRAPFDTGSAGIVPGEGVGVLLLKRLSDARRDGDRVHAIIRGIGGAHSANLEQSLQLAMERAFETAGVRPSDVALIEMDGTGMPECDQQQLRAVVETYGREPRTEPLLMSSLTGQIGHTMGASGMASLIKASLEIENGRLPATFGLQSPLPVVMENPRVIQAATSPLTIRHTTSDGRRLAAISSSGKGLAYHILLERGEKVPVSERTPTPVMEKKPLAAAATAPSPAVAAAGAGQPQAWHICRFAAGTPAELSAQLEQALANPAAAFAAAGSARFSPADRSRLAIVASGADSLAKKLQLAAKQFANPDAQTVLEQQGCFYRQLRAQRPRVAFLFPGQGSQYAGMLRELVRDVPAAAAAMREIDAVMVQRGYQTFGQMVWENSNQLGANIWVTQIAMLLADLIVHAAVVDFGIQPDLVASHSYGEFAALTAAGVWDIEGVITAARARYDAIEVTPSARGSLMATTASPQLIEQLAATLRDRAYVANYNAADQTVVGGRADTLKQLAELLAAQGHKAQILSVPCPYHTPLMAGSGEILKRSLDSLRLRAPKVPFLSSVTNRYVAEPEDIRTNLAAQLTTPVRYIDLVNRIADEQETVFVEVGPQQALTKLNRRILEGRNVAGVIGCDNAKYPGVEQLYNVRALLDCLGVFDGQAAAQASPARPAATSAPAASPTKGTISHFDATQRRIDKMRQSSSKGGPKAAAVAEKPAAAAPKPAAPAAPARVAPTALNGDHPGSTNGGGPAPRPTAAASAASPRPASPFAPTANGASAPAPQAAPRSPAPAPAPRVAPVSQTPVAQSSVATAPVAPTKAESATAALNPAELEKFLINFVVEQTGYPPEVVELDADLEADLGIDSIKKAQLFGELAEYFDVQPTENMTLDDFPTLRHVMNFLGAATAKGPLAASAPAPVAAPAPAAAAAPAPRETAAAPQTPAAGPALDPAELEKFLINFVVEQTGYPPEVVELDADLEADLGIDSIKKAQLFGELAEYFDVQPTENMTLDDFPTLRHVLNFLSGATAKSSLVAAAPAPVAAPPAPAWEAPVAQEAAPAAKSTAAGPTLDPAELEKFLINFVVEQTGYPPEVVELDADLEADLGIDSIKKAQLFGELAEYFDVQPTENMTLDDFPTLRHVLNFLSGATAKSSVAATGAAAPVAAAPFVAEPAPADAWTANGVHSTFKTAAAAPSPAAGPSLDPAELEKFLINFVVEQTGYPPEVVELDADLEADLGIDSIKKAQLFGELAEYFDVQPTENMTLDDFPTLRHVLNFLSGATAKGSAGASAAVAASAPLAASAPVAATASAGAWSAPVAQQSHETATATQARAAAPSLDPAELEKFLVNFVVEQTGYPPEVVELDADLEADLGIDSIKKAQLFGELAEYFDVQPNENMTLDDFPTLRHVLNFLAGGDLKKNLTPSQFEAREPEKPAVNEAEVAAAAVPTEPVSVSTKPMAAPTESAAASAPFFAEHLGVADDKLKALHLAGTPHQMGLEHGKQKKQQIRRILRRYVDLAGPGFDELPFELESSDDLAKFFTAAELEELQGIADAVQVPLTSILVHNLAIFSDFGAASLHFAVAAARNAQSSLLHASSEQLPLSSVLADCLEPVVQVRSPAGGIPHVVLSVAGAIGGLTGVNARGLAITAGSLRLPADGQPALRGRMHAAITSHVLSQASCLDSAVELLQRYRNGAAWNACLSHYPTDRLRYVESDGRTLHVRDSKDAVMAANHSALQPTAEVPLEARQRWNEVKDLLASTPSGGFTADQIRSLWSHHAGETNGKPSTNGDGHAPHTASRRVDVVIDPARGDFWVNPSAPANGKASGYYRFSLGELLPSGDTLPAGGSELAAQQAPPYDLVGNDEIATHRFATTIVDVPLDASVPAMPQWAGAALIVGSNPLGDALRQQLEAGGVVVRELPISDDLDETLAAFERIWNEQPTPHLFFVTGRDPELVDPNDEAAWKRRWYRVALLPFFIGQRWVQLAGQANLLPRCTFVGATAMNGDFGFAGHVDRPECAALTGLLKAVYVEVAILRKQKGMRATVIDAPDDESPVLLAANICRELAAPNIDYAVGFVKGTRRLEYAYPEKANPQKHVDVRPGGTWVFTGGARGITAECALELGRRFGLKLHLIGTSPLRPIDPSWRNLSADDLKTLKLNVMREARVAKLNMDDEWSRVQKDIEIDRSLRAFADAGVDATYHACDVANLNAMAAVLDTIRQTSGPIEGIVHGAGIERAGTYERKLRDVVLATLAAKVDGALNLMRLTRQDPVKWFIGFGSVSGRMGSNGQTDYCLASDVLCKLAGWYRTQRPGVHAVGFHWHPWDEVGMAARPETITMLKMTDGPARMSKQEGVNHLIREMYAGTPISEVLITTWDYHGRFYGTDDHPKPGDESGPGQSPTAGTQPQNQAKPAAPPAAAKPSAPAPAAPQAKWDPVPFVPLTFRSELKMEAAPLPPGSPAAPAWQGPAVILGHNPAALALRDRLLASGVAVQMLPATNSPEEAAAAMDAIYASAPPRYLFIMTGHDASKPSLFDHAGWLERRAAGVVVPFMAAQQWFRLRMKAKDVAPITVVAATAMGGDFGLSSQTATPEGGALCGMLKSIYVEGTRRSPSDVRCKVIDTPASETPASVVDAIFRELAANDPYIEVGWSRGIRSIVRSFERPVESLPKRDVPRGATWVVTGGARGVTAAAAFELGKRFGAKLHLIGRSPVPRADVEWRDCTPEKLNEIKAKVVRQAVAAGRSPEVEWDAIKCDIEITDTIRRFADAGIEATYYSCNLSNWDQLATILDEVRRKDGPIAGIMHGAGFARSGKFGTRSRDLVERTLAGKLDGAVGLMSLTRNDPVRYFLGFGSISGRYGGNGLSEYATSNDMLAKLIDWYRAQRPDCAASCMHWQSWDEIGMAMLGDSAVGTKGILKMAFIPPKEGVEHLCRELEAGLPSVEVLIGDGFFERTFYPFIAAAGTQAAAPERVEIGRVPLVEKIANTATGAIEAEIRFQPATDPFLFDHKLRGKPLLPAVIGMEAVAEAAALATGRTVVAIRDVQLIEGFLCHSDQAMVGRIRIADPSGNALGCELLSDFHNRAGVLMKKDRVHLRATAEVADQPAALDVPMPQPPTEWHPVTIQNDGPLYHGPTLHGLKAATFDARGGWGQLEALPLAQLGGQRTGRDWLVPATLVDAGFYVCGIHCYFNNQESFSLPSSIEAVHLGRRPRDNEKCLVQFTCREMKSNEAIYDFTVFGDDQSVIARVDGHRIVVIKP